MLTEIGWNDLLEWVAFAELEPFDEERADARTAALRATIANVNRNPRRAAFTPADFMLYFGDSTPRKKKQTWQEQKAIGQMIAQVHRNKKRDAVKPRPAGSRDGRRA
jgi:hypothetical protein